MTCGGQGSLRNIKSDFSDISHTYVVKVDKSFDLSVLIKCSIKWNGKIRQKRTNICSIWLIIVVIIVDIVWLNKYRLSRVRLRKAGKSIQAMTSSYRLMTSSKRLRKMVLGLLQEVGTQKMNLFVCLARVSHHVGPMLQSSSFCIQAQNDSA